MAGQAVAEVAGQHGTSRTITARKWNQSRMQLADFMQNRYYSQEYVVGLKLKEVQT